jgi:HTH-type transcriptional regulator/antitoxin HigA
MDQQLKPARVFPPGRVLSEELEARGWTQKDLAAIIDRPIQTINEIVRGTKQITAETALELAAAFDTSPEFWTNLEANYRLYLARKKKDEQAIVRKSCLYSLAPIPELVKRGWIQDTNSTDKLEQEVCNFLGISSLDEELELLVNFRYTATQQPEANAQIAWIKRVEHLAKTQTVAEFDLVKLDRAIPEILAYARNARDIVRIPSLLMELGVHFVIVPHLPKTYLDGAAFYLDRNPVVALTLRHDRIDAFWFNLMHELGHIVAGHQGFYLDNLDDGDINDEEREANQLARDWLIAPKAFATFAQITKPYFSKEKIGLFAQSQRRHSGLVLGRLQHEEYVGYQHLRSLLIKVKPFLKDWIDVSAPQ